MLRVYRFSAQLGFDIPEATINLIRLHKDRLPQVSSERIRDELMKILSVKNAHTYLCCMDATRLLSQIIPEIEEIRGLGQNTLDHSLLALEMFETKPMPVTLQSYHQQIEAYLREELIYDLCRRQILKLALLLCKGGAEMAVPITRRLRLGRKATQLTRCLVQNHLDLMDLIDTNSQMERRAAIRFLRNAGDDWLGVLLLFYANLRASHGDMPQIDELMKQIADLYYGEIGPIIERGRLITGDDILQTFGMMPGVKIGRILQHIEDLQFEGEIQTPEEALEAARIFLENCET
jgi:poly(A) polymerase